MPDLAAAEVAGMTVDLWRNLGSVLQVYSLAQKWSAALRSKCASSIGVFDAFWNDCMLLMTHSTLCWQGVGKELWSDVSNSPRTCCMAANDTANPVEQEICSYICIWPSSKVAK